ncbi:hypothetical protein BH23VER1_BH23VER1_18390 [soil metagenome]
MSPNARVCRACGADRDEVADQLNAAGIDDPDGFDYDAFIAEEFPTKVVNESKKPPIEKVWVGAAIILLLAFAAAYVFSLW